MRFIVFVFVCFILTGCSSSDDTPVENPPVETSLYFPPIFGSEWQTVSVESLDWNTSAEQPLFDLLDDTGTKAFIILKDGKIVIERYGNGADATTNLQWNSAAKTLSAFTMGIAQEEGFLDINDSSIDYLGTGWSSLTPEQESNISIWNHLTFTTGLDYNLFNSSCTDPECLNYLNEPSTFWYYHNATYTLTQSIIADAVGSDFNTYFNEKLRNRIGMQGTWVPFGYFRLYFSTARSMARFGLLNLNEGVWDTTDILNDDNYFDDMVNTSQSLNQAYGYLWWLNGKTSYRLPQTTEEFSGSLVPNAPADMYAGLGRDEDLLVLIMSYGNKLVILLINTSIRIE